MLSVASALSALAFASACRAIDWTLTSNTLNQTAFETQPYVANGYIGQRIPAAGAGYYQITPINATADDGTSGWPLFDPRFTAAMVAGFYDQQNSTAGTNFAQTGGEQPISTLPTWSTLYLTVDGQTFTVETPAAQLSNYSQSMSIQNGVVKTSFTWKLNDTTDVSMKYTLFAHRSRPNLGVVRLDVEGLSKSTVHITDVLDGAGSWRTTTHGAGIVQGAKDTIYSAVMPDGITNVTAYETSYTTFPSNKASATNSSSCFIPDTANSSTSYQCFSVSPSSGKLTAIKYVGIASSDAFKGTELKTALHASKHGALTGYEKLLKEHEEAWNALWDESDIIIPGEDMEELQLVTRASLFHLLSNVRQGSEGPGLGDNSIAPAGLTSDSYAGQVFWDADTWMFPSLLALFPEYAQSIVNYRYKNLGAAMENVKQFNRSGAIYPWTGARFGNCTGVGPCYDYEYHLENDISMAQYQYYASTQNETWLKERGWPVLSALAEFWASQVVYEPSNDTYNTYNETDPDEFANNRNNAAYTNAGISVTLKNAVALAGRLGIDAPSNWTDIAEKIVVLVDNSSNIVLEYDGFNGTTAVKQADVILLTYPLEYPQSAAQGLQDLDYYAIATSPNGPGMTYSIFSVDASALSPVGCASYTYLLAASQPYARAPFYQFSEQTSDVYETNGGTNPAYTFLTAHGGYLQSLTHGFTGYRSRLDSFYLDPILPTQLTNYTVKGMKWADSTFDVMLTTNETTVTRRSGTNKTAPVEIAAANAKAGNYTLKVGESMTIPTRATNGTLVAGNLAQCQVIVNETDTSFADKNATVVPGQYALAAIDGSNATAWQPLTNGTATMTVDLQTTSSFSGLHFNFGINPPTSFSVSAGNSSNAADMMVIANGSVEITAPYDAATAEDVSIKVGNLTDVSLNGTLTARYVSVSIAGSYLGDGKGGTLLELAVIGA